MSVFPVYWLERHLSNASNRLVYSPDMITIFSHFYKKCVINFEFLWEKHIISLQRNSILFIQLFCYLKISKLVQDLGMNLPFSLVLEWPNLFFFKGNFLTDRDFDRMSLGFLHIAWETERNRIENKILKYNFTGNTCRPML